MRTHVVIMSAAVVLTAAGAQAQTAPIPAPVSDIPFVNQIDFGVRGTAYGPDSDQARFQRYRDGRNGATVDFLRLLRESDEFRALVRGEHIGFRDQRIFGGYERYGRLKASFEWNQTPLYYSGTTATLYDTSTPGRLAMADSIQSGIQNKTTTLAAALNGATAFDLRTERKTANVNLLYSATPSVDVAVVVRDTHKTGGYPWGGSFGISNAIATEVPVPVDHRTTDLNSSLEFANQRAYGRIAYDGSFFRNDVTSLVWDNPARITDSPTAGPLQGRMALWPDTNMNTISATGGFNMAARTRATGYISLASLTNDNPLLPFTINSALVSPTLTRPNSDVRATVTTMNYAVTSRPTRLLWLTARYRQYDLDNRTEPFEVHNSVNYDTSVVAANKESEPFGQVRHTFDADASINPTRMLGFRAGYTREEVDRTYRIVEKTTENIGRASVDLTGLGWLTVRGVYEHGERRGSPVDELELLSIGEQPTLRQFDIADRNQDRFSAIVQVMVNDDLSLNGSASTGRQGFPGTNFGMRGNDNQMYSIGFDWVPSTAVSMGASWGHERFNGLQASRTANPLPANTPEYLKDPTQQFNDPRRDWTDDSADRANTVDGSIDLIRLIPKTDVRVAYSFSRAHSTYTYGLAPVTTLPTPVPLTPVLNEFQHGTVDCRYFVTRHLAVGGVYWFDKYRTDDFALGPVSSLAQPANAASPTLMMLGYFYRPYRANSVTARLTYLW